jgi:hypothetical protein
MRLRLLLELLHNELITGVHRMFYMRIFDQHISGPDQLLIVI